MSMGKTTKSQMEKQSQTNEALQKLNQQISTQLNRYRQELREMRNQRETERHESANQVREMKAHIQATKLMSSTSSDTSSTKRKKRKLSTPLSTSWTPLSRNWNSDQGPDPDFKKNLHSPIKWGRFPWQGHQEKLYRTKKQIA